MKMKPLLPLPPQNVSPGLLIKLPKNSPSKNCPAMRSQPLQPLQHASPDLLIKSPKNSPYKKCPKTTMKPWNYKQYHNCPYLNPHLYQIPPPMPLYPKHPYLKNSHQQPKHPYLKNLHP